MKLTVEETCFTFKKVVYADLLCLLAYFLYPATVQLTAEALLSQIIKLLGKSLPIVASY